DVNASDVEFTVAEGKIVFGLTAIKGLGRGAAGEIVRVRQEGGPFKDIFDLCDRLDLAVVSQAALEKLIKAGACDRFGRRAQLIHVLPRALQAGRDRQRDRRLGQGNLFDALGGDQPGMVGDVVEALPDVPEWPPAEKLKYEKEALDFYFSSHPLAQHG